MNESIQKLRSTLDVLDKRERFLQKLYRDPFLAELGPAMKLETYLDLQNVTFAVNPEVIAWTYDYGELDPITSNPPLPVFGLKGEW